MPEGCKFTINEASQITFLPCTAADDVEFRKYDKLVVDQVTQDGTRVFANGEGEGLSSWVFRFKAAKNCYVSLTKI